MKNELLKIVVAEYQKMTGLKDINLKNELPKRHIGFLRERLAVNYGFKIMTAYEIRTIENLAAAIQAAYDFYENLVSQVLAAAKQICGHEYASKQVLFEDFSNEEACIYKYKLCTVMFARHELEFYGNSMELKTAEDMAEYILSQLN